MLSNPWGRAIYNVTESVGSLESSDWRAGLPKDINQAAYIRGMQQELCNDPNLRILSSELELEMIFSN